MCTGGDAIHTVVAYHSRQSRQAPNKTTSTLTTHDAASLCITYTRPEGLEVILGEFLRRDLRIENVSVDRAIRSFPVIQVVA